MPKVSRGYECVLYPNAEQIVFFAKSFGTFRSFLKYKLEDEGKHFIVIDKFYPSSKTCSECGYINKELTLKDRM